MPGQLFGGWQLTPLAKALEPFLLNMIKASPASAALLLNKIILLPNGTGDPTVYPKTAAGLSSAYTDAADNDAIYIPTGASLTINLNITKAISIFGVSTYGYGSGPRVTLTGQHTFNNANIQLSQITLTSAAAGSTTATVNGGSLVLDRCYVSNTGTGAAKALVLNNDAKVAEVQSQFSSSASTSGQAIEVNGTAIFLGFSGGAGGNTSGGAIEVNGGFLRLTSFGIANDNASGYHIDNIGGTAHICGVYGYDSSTAQMVDLRTSGTVVDFCGGGTSGTTGSSQRYLGAYNYGDGTTYRLGISYSSDLRTWTRRSEPQIDLGAGGTFDDATLKDACLLEVDGIFYLYYSGHDGSLFKIGLARSFDGGLTWTKYASNPVLSPSQAWENNVNNEVHAPVVIYDRDEADSNKRWKMWYAGGQFGAGGIGYAYSADGLSWTKYASNPVLSLGSAGQWDDTYLTPAAAVRRGSQFVIFYNGNDGSGTWESGLATFTTPESSYTKGGDNPILQGDAKTTTISSNVSLGDVQITVADATIFPIGAPVWVYDGSNRYLTTVKERVSSTVLEMNDAAPSAISSTGGNVRSAAYNSVIIRTALYDDGWLFSLVGFQPGGVSGIREVTLLGYSDDLSDVLIDYGAGMLVPITLAESDDANVSWENLWFVDTWEASQRQEAPEAFHYEILQDSSGDFLLDSNNEAIYVKVLD